MEVVRVTSKGQLTLPANIRKKLGIRQGDWLAVNLDGNEVRLRRLEEVSPLSDHDPIWQLAGKGCSGLADVAEKHDTYLAEGETARWKE